MAPRMFINTFPIREGKIKSTSATISWNIVFSPIASSSPVQLFIFLFSRIPVTPETRKPEATTYTTIFIMEELFFTIATMDIIKAIKPTNKEIKALRYIVFLTPFLVSMFISMPLIRTFDATLSKRSVLKRVLKPFSNRTTEKRNAAIFTTTLGLRITNTPNTTTMIPEIK